MRYLKNIKTGVIMPYTDLLARHAPDLVECDVDGNAFSVSENIDAAQAAMAGRKAAFVLNTATGVLLPFTDLLAAEPGLVPVDSREEADALMARLHTTAPVAAEIDTGPALATSVQMPVGLQPPAPTVTADPPADIDTMTKAQLVEFARDRYGEALDKSLTVGVLREQVRVLLVQEAA